MKLERTTQEPQNARPSRVRQSARAALGWRGLAGARGATRPTSSGFTLIELVISATLMSMILAAAYACLRSGMVSQKLIDTRAEIFQSGRVALALISADLRCARTLSREYEFLGMHRMIGEVEADNLDFATTYQPRKPNEADFCETSYFIDQDKESGQFTLWRRRDPTPDDEPLSGGTREEIARGVLGLKLEYYDGWDWYDDWGDPQGKRRGQQPSLLDPPNLSGLPEAVRVTLLFDSNPRSARKESPEKPREKESAEPPLVFQTIARINLVNVSQPGTSSGPSGNNAGGSNQQPQAGGPQ